MIDAFSSLLRLKNHKSFLFSLALVLFFSVALLFRTIHLDLPSGLHADEASFLLNSISILQTGKDEDGRRLPLFLNSYMDPKPAIYSYLQIPFISTLGTSLPVTRLPSVLLGLASMVFVYLIIHKLFSSQLALSVFGLLCISPWHILLSRSSQEVILSFTASMAAIFFLTQLLPFSKKPLRPIQLAGFFISTFLGMYSYHAAKVFLPLLTVGWIGIELLALPTKERTKQLVKSTTLVTGTALAFIFVFIMGKGDLTRFKGVGLLSDQGPQLILNEQITTSTGATPGIILRLLYNKPNLYGNYMAQIYAEHLSPNFLFFNKAQPLRYKLPVHGLLYYIEFPLLILGIYFFIKGAKFSTSKLKIFWWAAAAILPAALTTQEIPSMVRSFPLLIPLLVITAFGIQDLTQVKGTWLKRGLQLSILGAYFWSTLYFSHQLLIMQPRFQPWHRNAAEADVATKLPKFEGQFKNVFITQDVKNIYAYLVLAHVIPLETLQESFPARTQRVYQLGKYTFAPSGCIFDQEPFPIPDEQTLYVMKSRCETPQAFIPLARAGYADGLTDYVFYRYSASLNKVVLGIQDVGRER